MIRKAGPADSEPIRELLAGVWQGDELGVAYHLRRPATYALVAEQAGQIVGYGQLSRSKLHPTYAYVGVHVAPAERGRGIGSELWAGLVGQTPGPFKTALYSNDLPTLGFLERRGLRVSLETHLDTLDFSGLPEALSEIRVPEISDVRLLPFTVLSADPAACLQVARLHHQLYQETHRHDPARPLTDQAAQDSYLGADLRADWLWLAQQGEKLVGVSSVRVGDTPTQGELGWFGTLGLAPRLSRQVTYALTLRALRAARASGIRQLLGEFDSVNPLAMWLRETLSFQPGRVWLTPTSEITTPV